MNLSTLIFTNRVKLRSVHVLKAKNDPGSLFGCKQSAISHFCKVHERDLIKAVAYLNQILAELTKYTISMSQVLLGSPFAIKITPIAINSRKNLAFNNILHSLILNKPDHFTIDISPAIYFFLNKNYFSMMLLRYYFQHDIKLFQYYLVF
jgi:hypothetical protein